MGDTATLVLLRHGESVWNQENRFTGWYDCDLSERGEAEARSAGRLLADALRSQQRNQNNDDKEFSQSEAGFREEERLAERSSDRIAMPEPVVGYFEFRFRLFMTRPKTTPRAAPMPTQTGILCSATPSAVPTDANSHSDAQVVFHFLRRWTTSQRPRPSLAP